MTTRQSALFALVLGIVGLLGLSGCSAGNPNMREAERAMEQQNYKQALANVDSAITQDSAGAEAYMMKARILRQMADSTTPPNKYKKLFARARKAEEKAIKIDPGRRSAVKEQRELAYIQEYQKGAQAFNRARKTRSRKGFLRAAAYFGAAGAIRPDSTGPILNEAFARLRAARLSEKGKVAQEMSKVIPILEKYIRKEEKPAKTAYTLLGQLYLQNKNPKKTIKITEQALEDLSQRPTHFRITGTKGVKYTGTIKTGGSSRSVEGTVPGRVNVSASEGTVSGSFRKQEGGSKRQKKGRLQVALYVKGTEAASKRTLSTSDTLTFSQDLSEMTPLAELRNLRLTALTQAGQTKRAMQVYRKEIKRNPKNATYRYNYGSLLLNADRYDAAAKQLEKAVELDPDDPKKQYNLGAAYLNKGVALQDSLVNLRDSLVQQNRKLTQAEKKRLKELDQKRRKYFKMAIPPLERARQLGRSGGQYRQQACAALFQAYVQIEQTDKAKKVKSCAGRSMSGNKSGQGGGGGNGGGG